jgi:hypothetical protein
MMYGGSIKCSTCGAPLDPSREVGGVIKCQHCGAFERYLLLDGLTAICEQHNPPIRSEVIKIKVFSQTLHILMELNCGHKIRIPGDDFFEFEDSEE